MEDYRTASIRVEMKQLLSFAEKVARDAAQVTPVDISALRSAGFSDRAILDAAHVAGFFCYMNRVVQAVGADTQARTMTETEPTHVCGISPARIADASDRKPGLSGIRTFERC